MSPDDEVPRPPVKDFMSVGHQALLDRSTDLGLRLDAHVCVCVCVFVCVCVCFVCVLCVGLSIKVKVQDFKAQDVHKLAGRNGMRSFYVEGLLRSKLTQFCHSMEQASIAASVLLSKTYS